MEGWECSPSPAPPEAPLCSQEGLPVPPCFLGKSSGQGLMTQGRFDFITNNENTANFEVLGKVDDGFLIPLPTQTLCRVLYTY